MILHLFIALVTTEKWFMYFFKMNDGVIIFCTEIVWTILMIVKVRQKRYKCFLIHYDMKTRWNSKKKNPKLDFKTSQKNHHFLSYWFFPDWSLQSNVSLHFQNVQFVHLILHSFDGGNDRPHAPKTLWNFEQNNSCMKQMQSKIQSRGQNHLIHRWYYICL